MLKFLTKRIISAIPVLMIVVMIIFFLMRVVPGDPALMILGKDADPGAVERLRETMGLNDPLLVQFVRYVKDIFTGNWGDSFYNSLPVFQNIVTRLEPTVLIMVFTVLISVVFGVPIGIIGAVRRNSILDYSLMTVSVLGLSIPIFWTSMMLAFYLGAIKGWFPVIGYKPIAEVGFLQSLRYVALPSLALGFQSIASIARYTRSTMLDVLGSDYIRTARAKGLKIGKVRYKHALKNALAPVVTHVGINIASLLGGATVCETVFNINGMGKLAYDSIVRRDYPQVQAVVLVVAIIYVVINILIDIAYKALDPRIELN
ncbi:MAG: ABC transporter permease [Oscillospiraceae bacterium]|jgi:peptide/nickel transport system permease protein|nr:ABC transporter permease [Oscillospiraceae bacterium]